MKFENKVAIITGSTRGIGRATAELFAKEGAKVVVVGTKEELGESYVNEIKAAGGEAIFCKTDVTSDESLDNLVKTTLDTYGKIDEAPFWDLLLFLSIFSLLGRTLRPRNTPKGGNTYGK